MMSLLACKKSIWIGSTNADNQPLSRTRPVQSFRHKWSAPAVHFRLKIMEAQISFIQLFWVSEHATIVYDMIAKNNQGVALPTMYYYQRRKSPISNWVQQTCFRFSDRRQFFMHGSFFLPKTGLRYSLVHTVHMMSCIKLRIQFFHHE